MLHIILYAIVPIFVVMALGYVSGKRGVFSGADASILNKVVLNYALPAELFVSIIKAHRSMLLADLKLTIVSFSVIICCFLLVYYIFRHYKGNSSADASVSALISGSPTIGFLGFAVLQPIFGASPTVGLVIALVAIVVNAVCIPLGLSLLSSATHGAEKGNVWVHVGAALKQPVAWAPILAVILVLFGVRWPSYLDPSFTLLAGANASVAVFAAGITLSSVKIVLNAQVWLGSLLKLFLMPAAMLIVGILAHMNPENLKMLVVCGSLPPAFSGIIIAATNKVYVATGTSSLALSTLLFMVTCPLWLWISDIIIHAVY